MCCVMHALPAQRPLQRRQADRRARPARQHDEVEGRTQRGLPATRCACAARALRFSFLGFAQGALTVAKKPQQLHIWAIVRIKGTPAAVIGHVEGPMPRAPSRKQFASSTSPIPSSRNGLRRGGCDEIRRGRTGIAVRSERARPSHPPGPKSHTRHFTRLGCLADATFPARPTGHSPRRAL
jgi:hypothetical protein